MMTYALDDAIQILQATPGVLEAFLGNLPEEWIQANEGVDTWSPFDVVGHLIHGERTDWIPRSRHILESGEWKTFEPFDRFAQFRESEGKSLLELLDQFGRLREQSLQELRALELGEADLEKTGSHPAFGQVSLRQLLSTWVVHDLGHIRQIARVLAKQYKNEVGPWAEYLRVVNE